MVKYFMNSFKYQNRVIQKLYSSKFIKKASVCVISVTGHLLVPGFLIKDKALGVIGQIVNKGVSKHLHITINKK